MRNVRNPSVFLVGAMKAGTSTVAALLGEQPGIFLSPVKEPNFFKSREKTLPFDGPVKNVDQWLNASWTLRDYEGLFSHAKPDQLSLDATTGYLVNPESPSMIREYCPDAKIIVILRNPIDRAYSAYNFMSAGAGDTAATFEEAIASELSGERDSWLFNWRYLYGGKYDQHLERWLVEFPIEQMLVLNFEALIQDSQAMIKQICAFLDVEYDQNLAATEAENATTVPGPLNRLARKVLINPGTWKVVLKPLIPRGLRQGLKRDVLRSLRKVGARPERMREETHLMLEDYYQPHFVATEAILTKTFGQNGSANPASQWLKSMAPRQSR